MPVLDFHAAGRIIPGMETLVKWIGGGTAAVVVGLLLLVSGGDALIAQEQEAEVSSWIAPEDVLAGDARVTAQEANATPAASDGADPVPGAHPPPPVMDDSPFVIRRVLPIEGPIRYGEWHWDDEGVPPGPLVIV